MRQYLQLLENRQYAILWSGATISILGDALTWTALVWLAYEMTGSTSSIGLLVITYTAPVLAGGLVAGVLLDRFDRRTVLIADNAIRGVFLGTIPLLHYLGKLELWNLYLAAGVYGLLKMISLAGLPSILPSLIHPEQFNTANAMESISWGVGGVVGPALAGILIGFVGGAKTIAFDAATYLVFIFALSTLPHLTQASVSARVNISLGPAINFIRRTSAIWFVMVMFMFINILEGSFSVILPVYTKQVLHGDAATFGFLLSAMGIGSLIGSLIVGAIKWRWSLGRSIAFGQLFTGLGLIVLVALPNFPITILVLTTAFAFAAPLTIWAQTIRMRLIPPELRGRVFSVLRTLMQSTPPLGGALGSSLITNFSMAFAILVVGLLAAIPRAIGLVHPALDHRHTVPVEINIAEDSAE